jgi:hypothetical protein
MLNRIIAALLCLVAIAASAQPSPVARVSALASGKLLLNGSPAELAVIEAEFQRIKKSQGAVWYYRENPQAEPPPQAMAVIKLVVQYGLPVSMSSKSDFTDYIDGNGRSQPRKP